MSLSADSDQTPLGYASLSFGPPPWSARGPEVMRHAAARRRSFTARAVPTSRKRDFFFSRGGPCLGGAGPQLPICRRCRLSAEPRRTQLSAQRPSLERAPRRRRSASETPGAASRGLLCLIPPPGTRGAPRRGRVSGPSVSEIVEATSGLSAEEGALLNPPPRAQHSRREWEEIRECTTRRGRPGSSPENPADFEGAEKHKRDSLSGDSRVR